MCPDEQTYRKLTGFQVHLLGTAILKLRAKNKNKWGIEEISI